MSAGARLRIASGITTLLPDARVIPYAKSIDSIPTGQPVVMVYVSDLIPSPVGFGAVIESIVIALLTPLTDPAKADEDLEGYLHQIVGWLLLDESVADVSFTKAERTAVLDYPAYEITCSAQNVLGQP